MSSGSAQLLVELVPLKPHIIGPRKARSEAQTDTSTRPFDNLIERRWRQISLLDADDAGSSRYLLQCRRRQRDADARRVVDQHTGAREPDHVAKERHDLPIRDFRDERRGSPSTGR